MIGLRARGLLYYARAMYASIQGNFVKLNIQYLSYFVHRANINDADINMDTSLLSSPTNNVLLLYVFNTLRN